MTKTAPHHQWDKLTRNIAAEVPAGVLSTAAVAVMTSVYQLIVFAPGRCFPGWVLALLVLLCVVTFAVVLTLYVRRTFRLERKFGSESFARAAARAKRGSDILILNTFVPNLPEIADDLTDALDRGVSVRVLILRKNCDEVLYRAETLGQTLDYVEKQIEQTLNNIRDLVHAKTKNRHLLRVRMFECWPAFSLYGTDRQIMVGYYWNGELAVHRPQLVLSSRHVSFDTFKEQFEIIWSAEHTKDLALPDWQSHIDLADLGCVRNQHEYRRS